MIVVGIHPIPSLHRLHSTMSITECANADNQQDKCGRSMGSLILQDILRPARLRFDMGNQLPVSNIGVFIFPRIII